MTTQAMAQTTQEQLRSFVSREVITNQSSLVDELLRREMFDLDSIENLYREPKIEDCTFRVEIEEEWASVRGNAMASGDDAYDKQVEDKILERLEAGNEWAWCSVRVVCEYEGYEADATLGCCSYEDETDFVENSGYYEDMKDEAFEALVDDLDPEPQEIYEWWIVTPWLLNKLAEHGEPVLRTDYGDWWGRTTTGQAILLDSVIAEIYESLSN